MCRVLAPLGLGLLIVISVFLLFLRVYGIPDPLLRKAIDRANNEGIPIDVERVKLTIRGWKAVGVRYYSKSPDDLDPLIYAPEIYFSRKTSLIPGKYAKWTFDISAEDLEVNPPVAWGFSLSEDSMLRHVDRLDLLLGFTEDRIVLHKGTVSWMNTVFRSQGVVMKPEVKEGILSSITEAVAREDTDRSFSEVDPFRLNTWEDDLKDLLDSGLIDAEINFSVHLGDPERNQAAWDIHASDVSVRDVEFSSVALSGGLHGQVMEIEQGVVEKGEEKFQASLRYDLGSGRVEGFVDNAVTSPELWSFLPAAVSEFMVENELEMNRLPGFFLSFGPTDSESLLEEITGGFSIDHIRLRGLELESVKGQVENHEGILRVSELQCLVIGQETSRESMQSCMKGGAIDQGTFVWDFGRKRFDVTASGTLDPLLLIGPLSPVRVATNVIHRFRFPDHPPQMEIRLGYTPGYKNSFYMNLQVLANDAVIHEAELSSANVSSYYTNKVLRLDPVAITRGSNYLKGSTSIDFGRDAAVFDVVGSVRPSVLEHMTYPQLRLFGEKIRTAGAVRFSGSGCLDWGTMETTDFSVDVSAEKLELPIGELTEFTAVCSGKGPLLSVTDAKFKWYDGTGAGGLSIRVDPESPLRPYTVDVQVDQSDFRRILRFFNPDAPQSVTGLLSGSLNCSADFSRDFLEGATGSGDVLIKNGRLNDLPLFGGFSRLLRKVIPSFNVFSITSLRGSFELKDGAVITKYAYFDGDLISAKGKGRYSRAEGFDAQVQVQLLGDNQISRVFRVITDPILKLLKLKLEGSLKDPSWRLDTFDKIDDSSMRTRSDKPAVENFANEEEG